MRRHICLLLVHRRLFVLVSLSSLLAPSHLRLDRVLSFVPAPVTLTLTTTMTSQEIKECAITSMGLLLAHLASDLTTQLPEVRPRAP